jgi:hypothetical protein
MADEYPKQGDDKKGSAPKKQQDQQLKTKEQKKVALKLLAEYKPQPLQPQDQRPPSQKRDTLEDDDDNQSLPPLQPRPLHQPSQRQDQRTSLLSPLPQPSKRAIDDGDDANPHKRLQRTSQPLLPPSSGMKELKVINIRRRISVTDLAQFISENKPSLVANLQFELSTCLRAETSNKLRCFITVTKTDALVISYFYKKPYPNKNIEIAHITLHMNKDLSNPDKLEESLFTNHIIVKRHLNDDYEPEDDEITVKIGLQILINKTKEEAATEKVDVKITSKDIITSKYRSLDKALQNHEIYVTDYKFLNCIINSLTFLLSVLLSYSFLPKQSKFEKKYLKYKKKYLELKKLLTLKNTKPI